MSTLPFEGEHEVAIVLPRPIPDADEAENHAISELNRLICHDPYWLELDLGAPIRLAESDPGAGPRLLVGPARFNPDLRRYRADGIARAGVWLDREREVLIADAPERGGMEEALNLLRTLAFRGGGSAVSSVCPDVDSAIERTREEVAHTYPGFSLRGLDWAEICSRHEGRVRAAADPLPAIQEWLAELQDGHTWAKPLPVPVPMPYNVWVDGETARLCRVPEGTVGWEAGARLGDALLHVDAAGWWQRTAAPPHMRPLLAGYRMLSAPQGTERTVRVRTAAGESLQWTETVSLDRPYPLVTWRRLPSGTGYLRVEAWRVDRQVDAMIDEALRELRPAGRLIVDLRSNGGGNFNLALSFRDRFLREPGLLGWVRYSTPDGGLSELRPLRGEPAEEGRKWAGEVRFLTDPQTYSASEDALLGLQGLPHVRVVGEPSGGGSGRPRTLPLIEGQILTISTVLTYDRQGHCVEGAGIPVDVPVTPRRFDPDAEDLVLLAADQSW